HMHQAERVRAPRDHRQHRDPARQEVVAARVPRHARFERWPHARIVCPFLALHLRTAKGRQAPLALCPGDPDRARLAAAELLEGARTVTEARGLLGFTGRYRGVPVTIQATGMGGGSAAIVVHELIELGARVLVRAGSTGGLQEDLPLGAIVVADRAVADDGAGL